MNRDYAAAGMRRASFAYWFAVLIAIAAVLSFATCIYGCFHIVDTASAVFAVFGLIASAAFSAVWIRIALDERRDPRP